jgi:hypothetical protein
VTFVSITRLRIRSLRFMPWFMIDALRTSSQTSRAAGFIGGSLLPDRKLTFWTMTLWNEQADMRRYIVAGAHLKTMPRLLNWCDEASIVHWDQDGDEAPDWPEADRRMRAEGRVSKVRHPSADHAGLNYRAPRTSRATTIHPR